MLILPLFSRMNMGQLKAIKYLIICTGVLFFLVQTGSSQIYFGITPIRVEHAGNPGDSITDIFYIRNNSDSPIRIRAYSENWILPSNGPPSFIGSETAPYSRREWIKVNPQDFRLNAKEVKMIRYTISIPDGTETGGYHASVSFENVPLTTDDPASSRMMFTGKIAAAVYIKVGDIQPNGEIHDLIYHAEEKKEEIWLMVKNTSRTHFRVKGSIKLTRASDGKSLTIDIPNEVVLSEGERTIKCLIPENLEKGSYHAFCKLDIGRRELLGLEKEFIIDHE